MTRNVFDSEATVDEKIDSSATRKVRIEATYDHFGDGIPEVWLQHMLDLAKADERISDSHILSVKRQGYGTAKIRYTVDADIQNGLTIGASFDWAQALCNSIVRDTDSVILNLNLL